MLVGTGVDGRVYEADVKQFGRVALGPIWLYPAENKAFRRLDRF